MAEKLTFTALGKQPLRSILEDRILFTLKNMNLTATDDQRCASLLSTLFAHGKYEKSEDHGDRFDKSTHQ